MNKADIDDFLELSCFFNDLADVGNLISGSPCLFYLQLEHLEAQSKCTVEAWLGEF